MKEKSEINRILGIKGFWIYELLDKQLFFKNKEILIALEFFLPPLCLFSIPLVQRLSNVILYSWWRIFSLLAAASWSFWGPYLIYRYHIQIIKFYQNLSHLKGCSIRAIFQNAYSRFRTMVIIITILWGAILLWIIIKHPETLKPYSLYGYTDFWYWVFIIYVFFILHLTACGFAGVIISFLLLKNLIKCGIITTLLQQKPRKLKAFGQFSFSIVLYFSSGIAFVPILIDFIRENSAYPQAGIIISIGIFTIVTCFAFFYPMCIIKQSAYRSRELLLDKFEADYTKHLYQRNRYKWNSFQNLQQINRYNSLYFIQSIDIELLDSSKIFTIVTTLIIPSLIGILEKMIPSSTSIASLINLLWG